MQVDKPEEIVSETVETGKEVTDELEKKEFGSELTCENMDVVEDDSGDCILEDVLVIDSEDGIDEDTIPSTDTDDAKQSGINSFI